MTTTPKITLNDSHTIPQLGFGVFQVAPEETVDAVMHALRTGYRHIDTAALYGNEAEVAEAIARAGVERSDVFVTTKVWNDDQGRERTRRAFEHSLEQLGFDYVELYLIHWPAPAQNQYVETWETLIELRDEARARSIGVSNFQIDHLERIIDATGVVPALNQVELHPRLQLKELRSFHRQHGIATEAWSPLGRGRILDDPVIVEIASSIGRTPAQVVLRWHVQIGNIVIPRSVNPARIEENFQIFDFELGDDVLGAIDELDAGQRIGPDPATFANA
jgi:diketogulonate reductase-like aldo/keto reductase